MCKLFEINEQKDLQKPAIFSKSSNDFYNTTFTGKLVSILFSFIFEILNFVLFSSDL